MPQYGLIGFPLSHSFSRAFFREKCQREQRTDFVYEHYELPSDTDLGAWLHSGHGLDGFNVTIPFKQRIVPHLDALDDTARAVGAVNTVARTHAGWKGYNTDVVGFRDSLLALLGEDRPAQAWILGTGGGARAVAYVLGQLGIVHRIVSRSPAGEELGYGQLAGQVAQVGLIVNTTPLGMAPQTDTRPDIPYDELTPQHILFDLVYNPAKTLFLRLGEDRGARVQNGLDMLTGQAEAAWAIWAQQPAMPTDKRIVDFSNTENAFSSKSDGELKRTYRLFRLMNNPFLVKIASSVGLLAVRWRLPFVDRIVRNTIFEQFCGGISLADSHETIEKLKRYNTATVLDYGAEGKSTEEEFDAVRDEMMRAIAFAAQHDSVPVVSCKVTGLADDELLEKISQGHPLNDEERRAAEAVEGRLTAATQKAAELGVSLFVDAEQSWMQRAIDDLVDRLMETYNRDQLVVYNTFQLYRTDRLAFLKKSHARAREKGYLLGAKLVRGAYMDKERERAREMGYPSPIQPDKAATDRDYNAAVAYCLEHYEEIALCNATHNLESCRLMAEAIVEKDLPRAHPHLNFCQLMGMSDYITFNLAEEGFNVAKYVPYGPVVEVVPYLVRRAQENASVTGEMSRELTLINREMVRRGLLSK